jgi:hypothetical protein
MELAVLLREPSDVGPVTALAARQLDDLAYGSGLWWGAIRRATCAASRYEASGPALARRVSRQ